MKIIIYSNSNDPKFRSLVIPLYDTNMQIGFVNSKIDEKQFQTYEPDVIIHDLPNHTKFPCGGKFISININETHDPHSFSIKERSHKNYIHPYYQLRKYDNKETDEYKYKSDLVFLGDPTVLKEAFPILLEYKDIQFRFFNSKPLRLLGYSGVPHPIEYYKLYKYAKGSIVFENNVSNILDIIGCGGNPIVYQNDTQKLVEMAVLAVTKNYKFEIEDFDIKTIHNNHTNYDRLGSIFSSIGLNKIAKKIKEAKNKIIGTLK